MQYTEEFKNLTINDIPKVGGKNASLGEMYSKLTKKGVPVPNGFAVSADAYWAFLKHNKLDNKIKKILKGLNVKNVRELARAGKTVRELILKSEFPPAVEKDILTAYKKLGGKDVAVRSSATAEDLPDASFAGQQESYLNIKGDQALLKACKGCLASLFTNRAISYREDKGFDHFLVALSIGVQQMVRSDLATSGVMFTLDTESGFKGVVLINAAYGLGEYVVKGRVTPDQYYVFKEGVKQGFKSIINRRLGSKEVKLVYGQTGTKQEKVKQTDQRRWSLTDEEVLRLTKWGMQIEEHYGHGMDIEWAKDGRTGKLYIVQARSETVKSQESNLLQTYKLKKRGTVLAEGTAVGQRIGQGKVRIIESPKEMKKFRPGEVLVTRITDPDWEPIMRIAGAIVTEQGGKTSHAAIVSRELGVPCIVGANGVRKKVRPGKMVTVSCSEGEVGKVYQGQLPFEIEKIAIKQVSRTKTKVLMNIGDPDRAFSLSHLPVDGVGLAREEFIFTNFIKIHPLALINYKKQPAAVKKKINALTLGYKDKTKFAVDKLAEGIGFLGAAFYPNEVILRLSDFKSNEYATLIGGKAYEPDEENPMLGWRGASRYYDKQFQKAFKIECAAIKKARTEWGLKNLIVMVPFCRTVKEGKKVLETMKKFGLERGKDGLQVYVMAEIPSNIILAQEFSQIFDGFSIGSNDLTQLTLGVDRDSALVSHVYDENNAAIKQSIRNLIQIAHQYKRKVGICGQAPSDYPEFAEFLVQEGIDSISLNPDTVLKTRQRIGAMEKKLGHKKKSSNSFRPGKILTAFGLVGLFFVLVGVGCQTVNNQEMVENKVTERVAREIAMIEPKLRQELKNELEHLMQSNYEETRLFNFSLNYPSTWKVINKENEIKFEGKNDISGKEFFSIELRHDDLLLNLNSDVEIGVPERKDIVNWNGYAAVQFFVIWPPQQTEIKYLYVYTEGLSNKNNIVVFSGNSEHFDFFLKQLPDFSFTPSGG